MENAPRAPQTISWYRTPLDPKDFKSVHERSDLMGWLQSGGFFAVLVCTGTLAFYSAYHWPLAVTIALVFLHGTVASFQINAMHELGHNTVFKTKALNTLFVRIFSFFDWDNYLQFHASHARHHRYTLHHPDDQEVVLPVKYLFINFFRDGFITPLGPFQMIRGTFKIARGKFEGEWTNILFPEGSPDRRGPMLWARFLLIGHGLILAVSLYFHLWILPVLTSLTPFYGHLLFFFCNNTQHVGLQDDVPDFRLCCRTFTVNPILQFLYWHMNYHIEHHMYAAVPCYKLGKLHRLIQHDLAPCPHGLVATWQEIAAIQKLQDENPGYQHVAPVPNAAASEQLANPVVSA